MLHLHLWHQRLVQTTSGRLAKCFHCRCGAVKGPWVMGRSLTTRDSNR